MVDARLAGDTAAISKIGHWAILADAQRRRDDCGNGSPLYGKLFGQTLDTYFACLATSIVVWQLVSETIRDSFQAFIGSEGFIKQVKLPLTIHVLRIVWKGLIVFAHNLVIVVLVFVFFPPQFGPQLLLLPLGMLAVSLNAVWLGVVLGLVCARFRDFPQIVQTRR